MSTRSRDGLGVFGGYFAKQCEEFVRKEYSDEYSKDLKVDPPAVLTARFEAGNEFEADLIEQIRAIHHGDDGVVILDSPEDRGDHAAMQTWQKESMDAFNNPDVWFIVNPRLAPVPELNLTGEPDFAVRSEAGGWYPVDAKDHKEMEGSSKAKNYWVSTLGAAQLGCATEEPMVGKPQKKDSMQLAHYHRMFQAHGLAVPDSKPVWGAIIGRSGNLVWRELDQPIYLNSRTGTKQTALEYYDTERAARMDILRRERARKTRPLEPLTGPEWKSECAECVWRVVCHDELREADNISLLPGITPSRAKHYRNAGINTVSQLSKLDHRTAELCEAKVDAEALRVAAKVAPKKALRDPARSVVTAKGKAYADTLNKLDELGFKTVRDLKGLDEKTAAFSGSTPAGLARSIDQARVTKVEKVHLSRDTEFVGFERGSVEVDVDFEDSNGYTYMFGMLVSGRKVSPNGDRKTRSEYRAFCSWDQSEDGEAQAFADFWSELMRLKAYAKERRYGFRSYYYTQHETHAIKTLAARHAGRPGVPTVAEVVNFMDSKFWIDLYPIVKRDMIWPTKDYTVKSVAKYVRHAWSGEGANGALSLVWYEEAVSHPDPEVRKARQEELLVYNRQDNEATLKIRDWITELSENQRRPGEKLPNVAELDKRFRLRP